MLAGCSWRKPALVLMNARCTHAARGYITRQTEAVGKLAPHAASVCRVLVPRGGNVVQGVQPVHTVQFVYMMAP